MLKTRVAKQDPLSVAELHAVAATLESIVERVAVMERGCFVASVRAAQAENVLQFRPRVIAIRVGRPGGEVA